MKAPTAPEAIREREGSRRTERAAGGLLQRLAGAFVLLVILLPAAADAQELSLKRAEFEMPALGSCPTVQSARTGLVGSPAVTDSLLTEASNAAILGDNARAASLFRAAAQNDPASPVIAYRLARTLDDLNEDAAAIVEYCRYLALAPEAPDAADIRARVRDLALDRPAPAVLAWVREGAIGVAAYDREDYRAAADAFSRLIDLQPELASAYYNRAVVHLVLDDQSAALVDLERYLGLLPEGEQDLAAIAQVESLRSALAATLDLSPPASATAIPAVQGGVGPGGALFRGLLFPGLGQLSTGRPFFGLAVLAATGGAIYYGTLTEEGVRRESGTDPFGNPYEYDVRFQDRPNLAVGVATAAGIAFVAAIESYVFVSGRNAGTAASSGPTSRPAFALLPQRSGGLTAEIRVALPGH